MVLKGWTIWLLRSCGGGDFEKEYPAGILVPKTINAHDHCWKNFMHVQWAERGLLHWENDIMHTHPSTEKKNFSCMKGLKKIMPLQLPNLPHPPTPQKSNGPSPSAISFGWFADFGKTLTINQRPSKLVYSDIREENYMFFFGQCWVGGVR